MVRVMNERQLAQTAFHKSDSNIIVGSLEGLPISATALAQTNSGSSYVVKSFSSGLTAKVYKIKLAGRFYTLKQKRTQARVCNVDGEYSFLNEVQRRQDFHRLKQGSSSASFANIVATTYANYRLGIILSPWIEGEHITVLTKAIVSQLFTTLNACDKAGLMEWDLCAGNLLVDAQQQLWLFDFGYMYRFSPCHEFNSNGLSDPLFHSVERFETRFLFGWMLTHPLSEAARLSLYRMVKEVAFDVYQDKLRWLREQAANTRITVRIENLLNNWSAALADPAQLHIQYKLDSFRSHVLDIEDDLHGKSCTPTTLLRIEAVTVLIKNEYDMLKNHDMLFYENKDKTREQLIAIYHDKKTQAIRYQS